MITKRDTCRCCLGNNLETVWKLGPTPLADSFLTKDQLDKPEMYYPLDVNFCHDCGFVQLSHVVSPEIIFSNYNYFSSTSNSFVKHFEDFAGEYETKKPNAVLDIGSNDGILLKPFQSMGVEVFGIEPALNVAQAALDSGVPTMPYFFTDELVGRIGRQFDLITATNVFAHVDDLDSFITNVKRLLTPGGEFVVECQYLLDQINKNQLGLVYHEHLSYWSVSTLTKFFRRHGMYVDKVKEIDTHNGSIRVHARVGDMPSMMPVRKEDHLSDITTYTDFNKKILENKLSLVNLLSNLKNKGAVIWAYGAAAKCMTPLNFFSIGTEIIDAIVDDSPQKQGKYTPGKHIPVVPAEMMYEAKPDFVLITAWNFADEIMKKHPDFTYIIPVPEPKII